VIGYYASIQHAPLLQQLGQYIQDSIVLDLVKNSLERIIDKNGHYQLATQGIGLSNPLSPLLGALYLLPLDKRMAELNVKYIRYMDDWVILAPSRWTLRQAIRETNQILANLGLKQHPE
jgi:retron-type reverse transcriptase